MKKLKDIIWFNLHDNRVMWFSMALILFFFFTQLFFTYRLFILNQKQLQKELDILTQDVYDVDLNSRLLESYTNESIKIYPFNITKLIESNRIKAKDSAQHKELIKILNIEIENYLNGFYPIDLTKIDSIASQQFKANKINLNFYSEIIDPGKDKVVRSSMPPQLKLSSNVMVSKSIALDQNNYRALRIVLLKPFNAFFGQLIVMSFLSLILSIVLVYVFYYLKNILAQQKELTRIKNDFFSDVSHEMKKPLSVISFVLDSFEREKVLSDTDKRSFYIKMGKTEIERMINQTEMILSLAKDDEGVFELDYVEFDIVELISNLADKFIHISEKKVEIEINDELDNHLLSADIEHVEYMITNLLINAVKYSKNTIQIKIHFYLDQEFICISIKDNGVGMSLDQQERAFDRYYRTKSISTVKGHGIGLNYVRRMVEKHHGVLLLNSTLGVGTEFIIKLPQIA